MNLFIYLLLNYLCYFFLSVKLLFLIVFQNLQGTQRILNIVSTLDYVIRALGQLQTFTYLFIVFYYVILFG